ncbi:Cof-type HAD-IIB family hydrolase [Haloimpatiens sp. FM7315]|uniref:Cof-type HAD-IIB family hydrolase n=1 Tax=Haloimpatiens sp. FM7315 TaxID=3298609 RepID=UPI00370BC4B8
MYKLLVLDMDGTLLNNKKKISQINKNALKAASNKGIKIAICTGRLIEGITNYLEELNMVSPNNYCITNSGALIQNTNQTKTIKCNSLSLDDLNYINDLCDDYNITYNIFSKNSILSPKESAFNSLDSAANNVPLKIIEHKNIKENTLMTKFTLINEDKSIKENLKNAFHSIKFNSSKLISNKNYNINLFDNTTYLPKKLFEEYTVLKTSPFTLEVLNKNSNKGEGVKSLAENLNIKREKIICIGDSGNDIHMIKYAGLGVAMGNAFPEVKEIADYITLTNEENGVAHVINKFII